MAEPNAGKKLRTQNADDVFKGQTSSVGFAVGTIWQWNVTLTLPIQHFLIMV